MISFIGKAMGDQILFVQAKDSHHKDVYPRVLVRSKPLNQVAPEVTNTRAKDNHHEDVYPRVLVRGKTQPQPGRTRFCL